MSRWYDWSGNGNNAIQTNPGKQALYDQTNQSIKLDGTDDYFKIPMNEGLKLNTHNDVGAEGSYYALLVYKSIDSNNTTLLFGDYETSTTPFHGLTINWQENISHVARSSSG